MQVRLSFALVSLLAGVPVALALAPSLQAQDAPVPMESAADSLAFPRQVLNWLFLSEADSLWAHASENMREQMGSPDQVEEASVQIAVNLGEETEVLSEQVLTQGERLVYLRGTRYAQVPEPLFWVVVFTPADAEVHALFPAPRAAIEQQFPEAVLP